MRHRDLTAAELDGLKAFAARFGRNWKNKLMFEYWPNARLWTDDKGVQHAELHRLRNEFGPSWLATFELPS
jgi:hypothetical protein